MSLSMSSYSPILSTSKFISQKSFKITNIIGSATHQIEHQLHGFETTTSSLQAQLNEAKGEYESLCIKFYSYILNFCRGSNYFSS